MKFQEGKALPLIKDRFKNLMLFTEPEKQEQFILKQTDEHNDSNQKIENSSAYGNAAAVFTQSGSAAKYVAEHASAGMIGVNIGVPVPREPFSFGGWNESKFGVGDITGKSSIEFFTKLKKITTKWNPESKVNWMS